MHLLQIRHGQTPSNLTGALDTAAPGAGLTPLGEEQARAIPGALADQEISAVFASPRLRTQLTAAPLAAALGLEVQVLPGLEEISAGELEMRDDEEAVLGYVGSLIAWMRGDLGHALPGGEDGHAFLDRYDRAVETIAAGRGEDETVVVVGHGAAIRMYTSLRAGLTAERAEDLLIRNTGSGLLHGSPQAGWRLVRWDSMPLGGAHLAGSLAHDITGESADEVAEDAADEEG